jgi:hypothetical protein
VNVVYQRLHLAGALFRKAFPAVALCRKIRQLGGVVLVGSGLL